MLTEEEIIQGCLRNNRTAQAAFYQKYKGRFFGICRRYSKNTEDAEDIFQEAFIKIFKNLHTLKDSKQLSAWVRRILVNTAITHYHKKEFFEDVENINESEIIKQENETTIEKLSAQELLILIQKLPDGARLVFNMYVIEGYNHIEIAKLLEIAEGTSKSQLFFAKKALKNMILKNEELDELHLNNSKN